MIEANSTTFEDDAGNYTMTVKLQEVIQGVQMPATEIDILLTVGPDIPPPPPPPEPKPEADPLGLPTASIYSFLMDSTMVLRFSKDINLSMDGLKERFKITIIPGVYSDPEVLKFDFAIKEIKSKDIELQFTFE